jgi:hypothetical protein
MALCGEPTVEEAMGLSQEDYGMNEYNWMKQKEKNTHPEFALVKLCMFITCNNVEIKISVLMPNTEFLVLWFQ